VMQHHERAEMTFADQPIDLAELHPTFGATHLLIDGIADCPDADMQCIHDGYEVAVIPSADHAGFCYSYDIYAFVPCQPYKSGYPTRAYFAAECNKRFSACEGLCVVNNYCSDTTTSPVSRDCGNYGVLH
jgi:hypothetical protein